ncbi:serine/threonine protein kinase [Spirosoma areae]
MPNSSVNSIFANYEISEELRQGPIRVLKAQHQPSGDLVIIKEYPLVADADTLRRFEHESQRMVFIDHPNLVRVREVQLNATMSYTYIVMDFVEAADLYSLLKENGYLDVLTTIRLGLQLTGAFRAMHSKPIIHRAINPKNILYRRLSSGELHFLLTDLGIANVWIDSTIQTQSEESQTTYEYTAPEQFDNPLQVDEAVDYYALGVILYECLTGKVPFALHNEVGLSQFRQQVLTAPLPVFTTPTGLPLPPSLATLLMCLLARNPQDRLHSVDQLELLLEQSRVEQLNASWSTPNVPLTKIESNSVMTVLDGGKGIDEPVDGLPKPTFSRLRKWWVEICIVLAAGLAFSLYNRTMPQLPGDLDVGKDSVSGKMPERNKVNSKSAVVKPLINKEENEKEINMEKNAEMDTIHPVKAEPVYQPNLPADSNEINRSVSDSVIVIPPDSTF